MLRLREEFIAAGKVKQFDHLVVFLNRDSDTVRYGGAAQMGVSAVALRASVSRMRRRYRKLLHAEVAETVSTPEEIEDEIRFLLSTLGG